MSNVYYAACCQTDFAAPAERRQIGERTARMCAMVEQTIAGYEPFFDVRLFAFPEFAHAAPIYNSVEELGRRLAVPVPNEHTERYAAVAAKYGCFIQTGSFIEHDPQWPGVLFNTTCLIGPQGVLSKYRKVNPWIPWELHASPHDLPEYPEPLFPVVETEIGRLGVATCYDWLFPEAIRQIAFGGAEVVVRISAYMDPWGATPPMDWWTLVNRTRAVENTIYVVAVNQGAGMERYPPFSWPGGSMIVDYDGRIVVQADPGEGQKVVVGPINLGALRAERKRRVGHDVRAHLRSEAYNYLAQPWLSPGGAQADRFTGQGIRERIDRAKRRLDR